jgi:hypothetical protein
VQHLPAADVLGLWCGVGVPVQGWGISASDVLVLLSGSLDELAYEWTPDVDTSGNGSTLTNLEVRNLVLGWVHPRHPGGYLTFCAGLYIKAQDRCSTHQCHC